VSLPERLSQRTTALPRRTFISSCIASVALSVALTGAASAQSSSRVAATQTPALKVALPGYIYSNDLRGWDTVLRNAKSIPVLVINPRSGPSVFRGIPCDTYEPPTEPGTGPNLSTLRTTDDGYVSPNFASDPPLVTSSPGYQSALQQQFQLRVNALRQAGIELYGYVWSNTSPADLTCPRGPSIVATDIAEYATRFGITNVFFDDASNTCPSPARTAHVNAARAVGAKVILNPGRPSDPCLANEADIVVNYEGFPDVYLASADQLRTNAAQLRQANPSVKIWHIVHSVTPTHHAAVIAQARTTADYVYLTDDLMVSHGCDGGPNPYDSLYGSWPIYRSLDAACATRANGNSIGFETFVADVFRRNRSAATQAPSGGGSARSAAPRAPARPN
jgi:hypothetical protein